MISFKPGDLMDDFGLTGDFEHFKYMLIKLQKYTNLSFIPLPQISATSIYLCSWYLTSASLLYEKLSAILSETLLNFFRCE